MTASNDLDRLLGAYLDDGPLRSPDRPVDAAIAFARTHPRRRDPLGFLKPDVMARRSAMTSPQLAWAALLVALTLGAVAAFAIGSRPTDVPVVPPPTVIESPSPAPSAVPSAVPSPSLDPSPSAFTLELGAPEEPGPSGDTGSVFDQTLTVEDASRSIVAVENGPIPTDDAVTDLTAVADPDDPTRVTLRWPFAPCDATLLLTIDAAGDSMRLERQGCVIGDTIGGEDPQIVLTFSGPVDPSTFDLEFVETP